MIRRGQSKRERRDERIEELIIRVKVDREDDERETMTELQSW